MPKTVTLKNGNQQLPIEKVKLGDIILIKPSDMIALDGKIVSGSSYVDESTITGEPIPKDKLADVGVTLIVILISLRLLKWKEKTKLYRS